MAVTAARRIQVKYQGPWHTQGSTIILDTTLILDMSHDDARCLMQRIHDILTTVGDDVPPAAPPTGGG